MFSDDNADILKYWKINPKLRKITNNPKTFYRIDETTWADEEGNLHIIEDWFSPTLLRDLINLKGKPIMFIGRYGSTLGGLRIVIGELLEATYGPCSTKIFFNPANTIELEVGTNSIRLIDSETEFKYRAVGRIQINNIEGLGLEIKELSEEKAKKLKNYLRFNSPDREKIIKQWGYE